MHGLPNASQAQDIHRASDADLASISAFAEAISRTQALLEDLRAKQEALAQSLARKRALLSPIRRIPLELLSTIISLAVTCTFRRKRDSSLVLRHPVLRVCQRWRALARATPQLWADVVFYCTRYTIIAGAIHFGNACNYRTPSLSTSVSREIVLRGAAMIPFRPSASTTNLDGNTLQMLCLELHHDGDPWP